MTKVSLKVFRRNLSGYLRRGERILITDRGRPLARVLPVPRPARRAAILMGFCGLGRANAPYDIDETAYG